MAGCADPDCKANLKDAISGLRMTLFGPSGADGLVKSVSDNSHEIDILGREVGTMVKKIDNVHDELSSTLSDFKGCMDHQKMSRRKLWLGIITPIVAIVLALSGAALAIYSDGITNRKNIENLAELDAQKTQAIRESVKEIGENSRRLGRLERESRTHAERLNNITSKIESLERQQTSAMEVMLDVRDILQEGRPTPPGD